MVAELVQKLLFKTKKIYKTSFNQIKKYEKLLKKDLINE